MTRCASFCLLLQLPSLFLPQCLGFGCRRLGILSQGIWKSIRSLFLRPHISHDRALSALALGYESHDGGWTQKQCMGTQKWLRRPWFVPYGREISPNMMFCKTKVKWPQRGLDGHGADCMGAFGYIFTGGHKNKRKWGLKIGDQGIFCRCVYGKKTAGSWRGCSRGQRGQSGGFVRNFGSQRTAMHMLQNLNPENCKQQGKKAKRASTNWCR